MRLVLIATALLALGPSASAQEHSLRFFGGGVSAPDADRAKIRIDDETLPNDPGPPVDVGAGDFTIEFWLRAAAADNTAGAIACGATYDWIFGNIVLDRDRFNQGRSFGISLAAGRIAFGLNDEFQTPRTVCGVTNVLDGAWHHIAVQRRFSDGQLWVHVDGQLDGSDVGPTGDLSYPDDGVPGNFCSGPCNASDPFIVLGAEKHDAGSAFPSYDGQMDELRFSDALRYGGASFPLPTAAFATDATTVGLYHFDEGPAGPCSLALADGSGATGGPSPAQCQLGGLPQGPEFTTDSPFAGVSVPALPRWLPTALGLMAIAMPPLLGRGGNGAFRIPAAAGTAPSPRHESP